MVKNETAKETTMKNAMREAVAELAKGLNDLHAKAVEADFDLTPESILAALETIAARA